MKIVLYIWIHLIDYLTRVLLFISQATTCILCSLYLLLFDSCDQILHFEYFKFLHSAYLSILLCACSGCLRTLRCRWVRLSYGVLEAETVCNPCSFFLKHFSLSFPNIFVFPRELNMHMLLDHEIFANWFSNIWWYAWDIWIIVFYCLLNEKVIYASIKLRLSFKLSKLFNLILLYLGLVNYSIWVWVVYVDA